VQLQVQVFFQHAMFQGLGLGHIALSSEHEILEALLVKI
jgi:hypothetical protein